MGAKKSKARRSKEERVAVAKVGKSSRIGKKVKRAAKPQPAATVEAAIDDEVVEDAVPSYNHGATVALAAEPAAPPTPPAPPTLAALEQKCAQIKQFLAERATGITIEQARTPGAHHVIQGNCRELRPTHTARMTARARCCATRTRCRARACTGVSCRCARCPFAPLCAATAANTFVGLVAAFAG